MKKRNLAVRSGMPLLGMALAASAALAQQPPSQSVTSDQASRMAESIHFYRQMHAVLSHPRCVNCQPRDDTLKQGLYGHVHSPPITRGPENSGPPGLPCKACHNEANFDPARVPVPLPKAEFDRDVAEWANTGAACPD